MENDETPGITFKLSALGGKLVASVRIVGALAYWALIGAVIAAAIVLLGIIDGKIPNPWP